MTPPVGEFHVLSPTSQFRVSRQNTSTGSNPKQNNLETSESLDLRSVKGIDLVDVKIVEAVKNLERIVNE